MSEPDTVTTPAPARAPRRVKRPSVQVLILLGVVLVWIVLDAVWLLVNRSSEPRNIDEYGYLSMALSDYYSGLRAGVPGWLQTVLYPGNQAPVTSAVSSVLFYITGPSFVAAMGVVVASAAAVIVFTFGIARRLNQPLVLWISVVLVATLPGLVQVSRLFVFAAPVAAVTMGAVYALVRSNHLRNLPWALLFGLFVGLMPLTRTMSIAYVPGLVLAALIQLLVLPGNRGRRWLNTAAAAVVALVVAGIWLVPSFQPVFDYLTGFGYGAHSEEYDKGTASAIGAAFLTLSTATFATHLIIMIIGWILVAVFAVFMARRLGFGFTVRRAVASPLFVPAVLTVCGSVVLATTKNAGLGFAVPIVPAAIIVAAWGVGRLVHVLPRLWERRTVIVVTLLMPVLVFASLVFSDSALALPRSISVPGVGGFFITQGVGLDQAYGTTVEDFGGPPDKGPEWVEANAEVVDEILENNPDGASLNVAYGTRNYFFNVNSVQIEFLKELEHGVAQVQVDPTVMEDDVAGYTEWLTTGAASASCWLITSRGSFDEFEPNPNPEAEEIAAAQTGFELKDTDITLPDGRVLELWHRAALCN